MMMMIDDGLLLNLKITMVKIHPTTKSAMMRIRTGRIKAGLLLKAPKSKLEAAKIRRMLKLKLTTRATINKSNPSPASPKSTLPPTLMTMFSQREQVIICWSPKKP